MQIYSDLKLRKEQGLKSLAILLDPDQLSDGYLKDIINLCELNHVTYIFFGGSLISKDPQENWVTQIKSLTNIPIVLFPGSASQINHSADAILLLSLISGRNPELLIGQHVLAAPSLATSPLEILPTGYILVDGGAPTTVSYMSQTSPVPNNKGNIAAVTALAGEQLGLKLIFLDAGSGANISVPEAMIKTVSQTISAPLIVGGGINSAEDGINKWKAGADLIVIGNCIEENAEKITEFGKALQEINNALSYL